MNGQGIEKLPGRIKDSRVQRSTAWLPPLTSFRVRPLNASSGGLACPNARADCNGRCGRSRRVGRRCLSLRFQSRSGAGGHRGDDAAVTNQTNAKTACGGRACDRRTPVSQDATIAIPGSAEREERAVRFLPNLRDAANQVKDAVASGGVWEAADRKWPDVL